MNRFLVTIGIILWSLPVPGQDIPVLPDVDVKGINMDEIFGLVGEDELKGLGDFWDMFNLDLTEAEIGAPKVTDFFNRDEKRIKYMSQGARGWLLNFVLSGRLAKFMARVHGAYILIAGEEKRLHEDFFNGHLTVNPAISNSQQVLTFRNTLHGSLEKIRILKSILKEHRELLSVDEYQFFIISLNNIITEKHRYVKDFENITTDHVLQATDGQRIKLIELVEQRAHQVDQGLYELSITLTQVMLLRSSEEAMLASLQALFGLTTE